MAALESFLIGGGVALLASALLNRKGVPQTPENVNRAKEAIASDPNFALDVAKRAGVDIPGLATATADIPPDRQTELDLFGENSGTSPSSAASPASVVQNQASSIPFPSPKPTVPPRPEQASVSGPNIDQDALLSLAREVSREEGTSGAAMSAADFAALATGGGVGALLAREFLKRQPIRAERVGDAPFPGGPVFDVPQDSLPGSQTGQIRGPNTGVVPTSPRSGTGVATGDVSNRPVTPSAPGPAQIPGPTQSPVIEAQQANDLIPLPPPTPQTNQTEQRVQATIDKEDARAVGARGSDVTEGLITIKRDDGRSVRAVEVDFSDGESVLVDLEGNIYSREGRPLNRTVDTEQLAQALESIKPRIAQILRNAARGL